MLENLKLAHASLHQTVGFCIEAFKQTERAWKCNCNAALPILFCYFCVRCFYIRRMRILCFAVLVILLAMLLFLFFGNFQFTNAKFVELFTEIVFISDIRSICAHHFLIVRFKAWLRSRWTATVLLARQSFWGSSFPKIAVWLVDDQRDALDFWRSHYHSLLWHLNHWYSSAIHFYVWRSVFWNFRWSYMTFTARGVRWVRSLLELA